MAKNDNLTDFLTDVADAIREKKGTTEKINPQEFSNEIASIKTSSSMWTGHVDVEGLKAIGWDDDDIAYFQEHGVNWMEEDDEYHKVSDDNKALYGVISYSNYKDYKDIIVYLPKFDMSKAGGYQTFENFTKMVGMPLVNFPILTDMYFTFHNCFMLTCLPPLKVNATRMLRTFSYCTSLESISFIEIDTSKVKDFRFCFYNCYNLKQIPLLSYKSAEQLYNIISDAPSLMSIEILDAPIIKNIVTEQSNYNLTRFKIARIAANIPLRAASNLSKESVLYIIENEAATEAITITLHAYAYQRLSTDPDIVAALAEHPLVSLASA